MPDLDPATLAERVLRLSRSPPFDQMPVEDVTVLAAAGREQSFPTRTVLVHAGERSMAHYVPLAGRLQLSDHLVEATGTYGGVGALSVLGGVVLPADLVADAGVGGPGARRRRPAQCARGARSRRPEVPAAHRAQAPRVPPHQLPLRPPRPPPTVRLDLVSRMLTLREALGLGIDGMATVARLARVARARQFSAGANVFDGHQPADVLILLEGSLLLKGPGAAERTVRPRARSSAWWRRSPACPSASRGDGDLRDDGAAAQPPRARGGHRGRGRALPRAHPELLRAAVDGDHARRSVEGPGGHRGPAAWVGGSRRDAGEELDRGGRRRSPAGFRRQPGGGAWSSGRATPTTRSGSPSSRWIRSGNCPARPVDTSSTHCPSPSSGTTRHSSAGPPPRHRHRGGARPRPPQARPGAGAAPSPAPRPGPRRRAPPLLHLRALQRRQPEQIAAEDLSRRPRRMRSSSLRARGRRAAPPATTADRAASSMWERIRAIHAPSSSSIPRRPGSGSRRASPPARTPCPRSSPRWAPPDRSSPAPRDARSRQKVMKSAPIAPKSM